MDTVQMTDMRQRLREIMNRVKRGETVTITEYGTPVAELVPPGTTEKLAELEDGDAPTA